jgi:hypothetical protein
MSLALQYLMVCAVVRQVHVPIQVVKPVRDDGGQVANTERAVCLGCNKEFASQQELLGH